MKYRVRLKGSQGNLQRRVNNAVININIDRIVLNYNNRNNCNNVNSAINDGAVWQGLFDELARQNAIIDKLMPKLRDVKTEIKEV